MKSIDIRRSDRYIAREMVRVVFYLDKSHSEAADSVFVAFQQFLEFAPKTTAFLLNQPGGDWDHFELSADLLATIHRRLLSDPREPNCSLIVCSDDTNISDFSFEYSGFNLDHPDFALWASVIKLTMPPKVLDRRRTEFQSLFMSLLAQLPAFTAYSSISLEGDQAVIQKVAKRNLGVDISSVSSIAKSIGRRAAGVYWLNAFKGDLSKSVRMLLSDPGRPEQVQVANVNDETTVILLSHNPDRLPVHSNDLVISYRWLACALDEHGLLHVSGRIVYFEDEDVLDDSDAQRAWHRRFLATE